MHKCLLQTASNVMGPTGTTVTFPEEMRIPSILNSKPISYPPPREKCVGPSCTNPYKYLDSKSKLPLCILQFFKAVHEKLAAETTSTSLDVTNDPLSLAYANGTTLMVFCLGLLAEPSYWRLFIYSIILFDALLFRQL